MWNTGRGYAILSKQQLDEPLKVLSIKPDHRHDDRPAFALFLRSEGEVLASSPCMDEESVDDDNPSRFPAAFSKGPVLYGADGMMYVIITPHPKSQMCHKSSFVKPRWIIPSLENKTPGELDWFNLSGCRLVGSLIQKDGHVHSLAVSGDLLYCGSQSKNIRVWKDSDEFSWFKSNSGLVKTIVIFSNRIFTGHQDGKIRIWTESKNANKRVGSLPTWQDMMKCTVNPRSYVRVRRRHKALRIRHFDAVSCLSVHEEAGILYSGSWDKTVKVWRIANSRCMESVNVHDDAVNTVLAMGKGILLTGSAEGTVKAWRREVSGPNTTRHVLVRVLLSQESAVTSLAVNSTSDVVYCGSSDGVVNFWTVTSRGQEMRHGGILWGHRTAVLCLATGGSRLVFCGSADKSVRVWRREKEGSGIVHTCLGTLTGHTGPIKCLAVMAEDEDVAMPSSASASSDEGDRRWRLYSGSLDGSVRVWSVAEN
ncbi:hypothetical protein MLD38_032092 [Melastoma candidum]|uniref:Uncharacterized protein n=1 Tax=Melastoma candidum TaxID=119954 RepID=A0ACB9M382_9MYRT|nr:hypothetical protein MLD38_032092 [Melastoma candidum]